MNTWIFQGNPAEFRIEDYLRDAKGDIQWRASQHKDEIKMGDRAYIWRSGPAAGVIAECIVTAERYQQADEPWAIPYWTSAKAREDAKEAVDQVRASIQRVSANGQFIARSSLLQHPTLQNLSIIRQPRGTNFEVTPEEAVALADLWKQLADVMPSRRYWWVNQNQTYKQEVEGGFLWSPKTNRDGGRNPFYDFMKEVRPGDIVFSFCDTRIKAIGVATGSAETAAKPEFGAAGNAWDLVGWLVPVEFEELTTQIRPKDSIEQLRALLPNKYSPLQSDGDGNQGVYLTALPEPLAQKLMGLIGTEFDQRTEELQEQAGEHSPNER
jgi:hypothetical protein